MPKTSDSGLYYCSISDLMMDQIQNCNGSVQSEQFSCVLAWWQKGFDYNQWIRNKGLLAFYSLLGCCSDAWEKFEGIEFPPKSLCTGEMSLLRGQENPSHTIVFFAPEAHSMWVKWHAFCKRIQKPCHGCSIWVEFCNYDVLQLCMHAQVYEWLSLQIDKFVDSCQVQEIS